ncbi:MAG: hypothetical protein JSV25_01360 [Spirochaetota bacterium]|nr:MAG: hypothetical protein JSV25_01360 [Spirochaetota bacterium]
MDSRRLDEINELLLKKDNPIICRLLKVVDKYGGVEKINSDAEENGKLEKLLGRLREVKPDYFENIEWLIAQRDQKRFVSMEEYRQLLGVKGKMLDESFQVTLEISSLHYFTWFMKEAESAVTNRELMPARFIRVRCMKEQEKDGDLFATICAMKVLEASWVESLDTRGTDGSNVHLGGPETITGYFGGIGQPNDYVYKWIDEYLYYYTNYGVKQVLNINGGTVLAGYLLHKLGIDMEFKISVFMGNDNPLSVLWTLLTAKLFTREDGSTPLVGLNLSNSVNNETIEIAADIRNFLGFEDKVRMEHHIVETHSGIVRQPYDRLTELIDLVKKVKNISAKHEGGIPETEAKRDHPSDILEYFLSREEIDKQNLMQSLERNYLDKHDAVQRSAKELIKNGFPVLAAPALHYH